MLTKYQGWWWKLSLIWLMAFWLVGCSEATPTPALPLPTALPPANAVSVNSGSTVRIYVSLPLSSSSRDVMQSVVNGYEMALADFTGGTKVIGNLKIELMTLDDALPAKGQWDTNQEKANAARAANDPQAMLYLGPANSGAAQVSIPILNGAGLAMIADDTSYSGLTKNIAGLTRRDEPARYYPAKARNFFRLIPPDDLQGAALVEFMKALAVRRVFVIDDSQLYGRGLAQSVADACRKASLDCSRSSSITGQEKNYQALATLVKAYNPDAVFYGGIPEQQFNLLLHDLRAAGLSVPVIGGDSIQVDDFLKAGDPAQQNLYASSAGLTESHLTAKGRDVWQRYQVRFTGATYPTPLVAYDAMTIGLTAIRTAGKADRQAILQAVAHTRDFDGLRGKLTFDPNGDTSQTDYTIWRVVNGKWQPYSVVRPPAN